MSLHYKTSLIYFEIFAYKWITVLTVSGWKKTLTIRKILDAKQPLYLHICHVMMKGLGNGGESYKKQYRLRQIKSWLLKPDTTRIDLYSFALPSSRKNKKSTQIIKRLKRGTCKSCLKQNLFEKKACFGLNYHQKFHIQEWSGFFSKRPKWKGFGKFLLVFFIFSLKETLGTT